MSKQIADATSLTVRRPDGSLEEVVNTQHGASGSIGAQTYQAMVAATRKAGRGEIISQRPRYRDLTLSEQRDRICSRCDDCDAFPGSTAWLAARAAEAELAAFDAEHPEIAAAINARRAKRAPRNGDAVARMLANAD